jgi:hypothetical protein
MLKSLRPTLRGVASAFGARGQDPKMAPHLSKKTDDLFFCLFLTISVNRRPFPRPISQKTETDDLI